MLYVHDNLKGSLFVHHLDRSLIFATTPLNKEKCEPVEPCRLQAYKNGRHVLSGTAHQNEYIENPEDMRLIFLDYAQL
jgi:glutamine amidotransferase